MEIVKQTCDKCQQKMTRQAVKVSALPLSFWVSMITKGWQNNPQQMSLQNKTLLTDQLRGLGALLNVIKTMSDFTRLVKKSVAVIFKYIGLRKLMAVIPVSMLNLNVYFLCVRVRWALQCE